MSTRPLFEVCVDSVAGCIAAERAGAGRVELCADLLEGGTTPSAGTLAAAHAQLTIPIAVLVRPRGGDFLYTDVEMDVMARDIDACKNAGAAAVVIGMLKGDGTIDMQRTLELVERARPMQVTFHRAFDMTREPSEALEQLVELGVDRVLTSGQKDSASDSLELLAALVERAGDRITVMPGGITAENIGEVAARTGAREVHFAARVRQHSSMTFRNPYCGMGSGTPLDEFEHWETTEDEVRRYAAGLG